MSCCICPFCSMLTDNGALASQPHAVLLLSSSPSWPPYLLAILSAAMGHHLYCIGIGREPAALLCGLPIALLGRMFPRSASVTR
jgi:hypothetical protein